MAIGITLPPDTAYGDAKLLERFIALHGVRNVVVVLDSVDYAAKAWADKYPPDAPPALGDPDNPVLVYRPTESPPDDLEK